MSNKQLPAEVQERIEMEATNKYISTNKYIGHSEYNRLSQQRKGYIAGATAVHDRAQALVDALEWLKTYGPVDDLTIKFIDKALNQWKGKATIGNL